MSYRGLLKSVSAGALLALATGLPAQAAGPNFTSNVIIEGSLCVGFDCVPGMAFGFDTIVMQENNLRVFFNDTSTAAAFPRNDWRLTANDSTNGGASHFSIEDATAGRFVFRVFAGARSNALVVDAQGDLGLGTSTPAVDIDIKTGDTPTVRLQQDGTSGFTPQTWDVAGNEAGFFIRDATSGSTLPFRIITGGAPSQSLVIDGAGEIGMGVGTNPQARLHVSNGGTAYAAAAGDDVVIQDDAPARLVLVNTAAANPNWIFNSNNTLRISAGADAAELELDDGGDMTILGTLTENSDKNNKMAIEPVDTGAILEKVAALPVSAWTYKHDARDGIRHIGPMAQDFYALFGTGASDRGISTLDTSGVALAAIQALSQQNAELRARLDMLEDRLAE